LTKRANRGTINLNLDEQAFRYNNRKGITDGERFDIAVRRTFGNRVKSH
jgi:hypothetical protein